MLFKDQQKMLTQEHYLVLSKSQIPFGNTLIMEVCVVVVGQVLPI